MNSVHELYQISKAFSEHVEQPLPKGEDERDEFIAEIDLYLEKRKQLMSSYVLTPEDLTDEEKQLGREIVDLNTKISQKLVAIKEQIGKDIAELKLKKKQGQKYENPYEARTDEGVFFDKRGV
ncbi:hypothetical protein [Bacillus alkalicellulosilyticus]|uniref:hypothetical protein n=1 Tax=Alkalihalobacterium alkalicellulosilyticum TaxID=1912214 RepID=UPI0009979EBF|nr:hypothetical protein [Bacillus alkalicellulosilyticus]